jgi:hypothetical protein
MIHLLYQELLDVYRTVLLSFLAIDHIGDKQGAELLLIDHKLPGKQLNDKQIKIGEKEKQLKIPNVFFISGEETRKSLAFLSKEEKERFFMMCEIFFNRLLCI